MGAVKAQLLEPVDADAPLLTHGIRHEPLGAASRVAGAGTKRWLGVSRRTLSKRTRNATPENVAGGGIRANLDRSDPPVRGPGYGSHGPKAPSR